MCPDVYRSSGEQEPDERFEPGELRHLVPGNHGRLLDPRRTPVTLTAVSLADGMFQVRIEAFEDAGATWRLPFEDVGRDTSSLRGSRGPRARSSPACATHRSAWARS